MYLQKSHLFDMEKLLCSKQLHEYSRQTLLFYMCLLTEHTTQIPRKMIAYTLKFWDSANVRRYLAHLNGFLVVCIRWKLVNRCLNTSGSRTLNSCYNNVLCTWRKAINVFTDYSVIFLYNGIQALSDKNFDSSTLWKTAKNFIHRLRHWFYNMLFRVHV